MTHFFVFDEHLMWRCQAACAKRMRIRINTVDVQDGSRRTFEGLVRDVEDCPLPIGQRWRVNLK